MNFIVSGDQHLYVPRSLPQDWSMNRFRMLWDFYVDKCKEFEAGLILSGDLFHTTKPNLAETQLLIELLIKLKDNNIETYIISGNHENIGNGSSCLDHFADLFSEMGVRYYQSVEFGDIALRGHTHLQDQLEHRVGGPLLITHVRPTVNQFIQEEVDIAKLIEPYKLVVSSDIHQELELYDGKLVYTNAPLNNHFEEKPNTSVIILDTETLKWSRLSTNHLPQLVQITCKAEDFESESSKKGFGHYYRFEVTGTPQELRKISTDDLNCKLLKVPEVVETYIEVEDAVEIRDLAMEEALIEYMKELKFEEDKITKMITVLKEV